MNGGVDGARPTDVHPADSDKLLSTTSLYCLHCLLFASCGCRALRTAVAYLRSPWRSSASLFLIIIVWNFWSGVCCGWTIYRTIRSCAVPWLSIIIGGTSNFAPPRTAHRKQHVWTMVPFMAKSSVKYALGTKWFVLYSLQEAQLMLTNRATRFI